MEKRYGILILGTFACAACFLLSDCAGPAAEQSSVQPPYDGQIQDADVFIDMPNLRQYGGYTCGTHTRPIGTLPPMRKHLAPTRKPEPRQAALSAFLRKTA